MIEDIIYYDGNLWFKEDKLWKNANKIWDKDSLLTKGFGYKLKESFPNTVLDNKKNDAGTTAYFNFYVTKVYGNPIEKIDDTILFAFKNGYIDREFVFHPGDVPFTTVQIPMDYNPLMSVTAPNTEVMDYLNWMVDGNIEKIKSMTAICGSLLSTINDGLFGILYSKNGGTGKTQLLDAIQLISPNKVMSFNPENTFGKSSKNNKFALTNTNNKTGLIGQELPINLDKSSSDLIKALADPGMSTRTVEDKGSNMRNTNNNLTLVVSTNRISNWFEVDNALMSRITVVDVKPNETAAPYDAGRFDRNIRKNEEALEYLMNLCVANYLEAKNGWRAEGFRFNNDDTEKYWDMVKRADSIMLDFAEEGLFEFIDARESEFLPYSRFEQWFQRWNAKNGFNMKVTQLAMKKKTVKYFEDIVGVSAELGATRKIDGKNQRGILIKGFTTHPMEEN